MFKLLTAWIDIMIDNYFSTVESLFGVDSYKSMNTTEYEKTESEFAKKGL